MSLAEPFAVARRRKILVVVGSLDVGGVEMDILRNFPRLDRRRFDVRVYAFIAPGTLAPRLAETGIELVLPSGRIFRPAEPEVQGERRLKLIRRTLGPIRRAVVPRVEALPAVRRTRHIVGQIHYVARLARPLAKYVKQHRIDVIHAFLPHAYLVAAAARAMTPGVKLVMSRVSSNFYFADQPQYRFAETRFAHRLLDAAVCNAASIERELIAEGIASPKVHIVRNGIDTAPFADAAGRRAGARKQLGLVDTAFVMTTVANLHPYKGHADLIDALAAIAADLPSNWLLLCAGRDVDGTRAALERQAAELGIAAHIRFLGNVDDIPALLAASDLHIHPSREDAFPNSVLEAMASGLAVVATRVGGLPELVPEGDGGLLVPARDASQLGRAIRELAAEPQRRHRMGEANRRRVADTFSIEVSVAAYERLYDRLLAPHM